MSVLRIFDPWQSPLCTCPRKYTINPYTGCSHNCLYCYATSYIHTKKSTPKKNLIQRLKRDLRNINPKLPVDISLSSDPYPPEEKIFGLTKKVLDILLPLGIKVQITTKGTGFLDYIDFLSKHNFALSMTITTLDSSLAKKIEPNAPKPSERLRALEKLADYNIPFSVRIDPIIPKINDDPEELQILVKEVANIGAKHIVTSTYKAKPDNFKRMLEAFPEYQDIWFKLYYPRKKLTFRYAYLPKAIRAKLLLPITTLARKLGISYATCRESLVSKEFFHAKTCDGTHLIPHRVPVKLLQSQKKLTEILSQI